MLKSFSYEILEDLYCYYMAAIDSFVSVFVSPQEVDEKRPGYRFFSHASASWTFSSLVLQWAVYSILYGRLTCDFISGILLSGNEENMLWYWLASFCVVWWQLQWRCTKEKLTLFQCNWMSRQSLLLTLIWMFMCYRHEWILKSCLVKERCDITVVGDQAYIFLLVDEKKKKKIDILDQITIDTFRPKKPPITMHQQQHSNALATTHNTLDTA